MYHKIKNEVKNIETNGPFTEGENDIFTPLMAEDIHKQLASFLSDPFNTKEIEEKISDNFFRLLKY